VASAYLQRIQAILHGETPVTQAKPPETKHPQAPLARALAQAMPSTGQPRSLAAFLAPVMEIVR
jgi:hypothetical protein